VKSAVAAPAGPLWIQIVLSALGMLGGTGGVTAIATMLLRRRRFRADTADVLTDTALALVEPLKLRVVELEAETANARRQAAAMNQEIGELRRAVREVTVMMGRWRAAILAPDATIEKLRDLIHGG
jgi:hypothetical protein